MNRLQFFQLSTDPSNPNWLVDHLKLSKNNLDFVAVLFILIPNHFPSLLPSELTFKLSVAELYVLKTLNSLHTFKQLISYCYSVSYVLCQVENNSNILVCLLLYLMFNQYYVFHVYRALIAKFAEYDSNSNNNARAFHIMSDFINFYVATIIC